MAKCRNFSPEFKAKDALAADAGRGILEHTRSDNGPEFLVQELRQWLGNLGTGTLFIEPGSPWENGYCESFNGKLRDECLNGEIFYSLKQTQIVIEGWRVQYNRVRRRARARRRAFSQPSRRDKSGRERPKTFLLVAYGLSFLGDGRARSGQSEQHTAIDFPATSTHADRPRRVLSKVA